MEHNLPQMEITESINKPLKKFSINASYTFTGTLEINAENKAAAIEIFRNSISLGKPSLEILVPEEIIPVTTVYSTVFKKACKITLI